MQYQTLNNSIFSLYKEIENHINLIESYSEKKGISFLIKSLRMKPHDILLKKKNALNLLLYKEWIDEFGNSLIINEKKFKIIRGDLVINRNLVKNTDIYYGLSLKDTIKISNLCAVIIGKDEDLKEDCIIIHLLGIDNYFRSFMYYNSELFKVPTLNTDIYYLLRVVNNKDIRFCKKSRINKKYFMNGKAKSIIFGLPIHKMVLSSLKEISEKTFDIITK